MIVPEDKEAIMTDRAEFLDKPRYVLYFDLGGIHKGYLILG